MDNERDEQHEEPYEAQQQERHRRSLFLSPIELACVLVVIGILGSLTWGLRGTRESSICISRLKQVGLSVMQYTRDYDEKMPTLEHNWPQVLSPYAKNPELFDCPAPHISYAMYARLGAISLSYVDTPAAMPMAFDSTRNRLGLWENEASWPTRGVHRTSLRGPSGANTLYFDGHVKWSASKPPFNGKILRPQVLRARWTFERMRDIARSSPF